jgi:hypothetical protein
MAWDQRSRDTTTSLVCDLTTYVSRAAGGKYDTPFGDDVPFPIATIECDLRQDFDQRTGDSWYGVFLLDQFAVGQNASVEAVFTTRVPTTKLASLFTAEGVDISTVCGSDPSQLVVHLDIETDRFQVCGDPGVSIARRARLMEEAATDRTTPAQLRALAMQLAARTRDQDAG